MSKRILLAGCGQLGSRHLQAIASLKEVKEIHVVDASPDALELGKTRIKEIPDLNPNIEFRWLNELKDESSQGDLCIVATQAKGRCPLVKQIAEQLKYKYFFIEKMVSQSMEEYHDLLSFSKGHNLSIWVDCKSRTYEIHKHIKSFLRNDESILFNVIGGNHGLANNGIHSVDLFVFYDGAKEIKSAGSDIDPKLHATKRNQFDLSGTLFGRTERGSQFTISFASNHECPDQMTVMGSQAHFIVDHLKRKAFGRYADQNWDWQEIPINEEWRISHMTKAFAQEILTKQKSELPTLEDCLPAHEFILGELQPHFNRLMNKNNNFCPVS